MAKNFFQPIRMASQYVATDVITVKYVDGTGDYDEVKDGLIVELDGFDVEAVYSRGFGSDIYDINTRIAKLPVADAGNVCVIDLAYVPTATNGTNTYRIGTRTIGLTQEAGVPVRARKLKADDTFKTGLENCTAALTVNEFAAVDATGAWKPAATAPATGTYCQVINSTKVTEGVTASVSAYDMLVIRN